MESKERYLYHQIHPIKLVTDWGFGAAALVLLWHHSLVAAVVVAVVPSIVASVVILNYVDLTQFKTSRFGRYVARHMTRFVEAARFAGFGLSAVAAWLHIPWLIALGVLAILSGWMSGLVMPLFKQKNSRS